MALCKVRKEYRMGLCSLVTAITVAKNRNPYLYNPDTKSNGPPAMNQLILFLLLLLFIYFFRKGKGSIPKSGTSPFAKTYGIQSIKNILSKMGNMTDVKMRVK
jgi:hypothetical protein